MWVGRQGKARQGEVVDHGGGERNAVVERERGRELLL